MPMKFMITQEILAYLNLSRVLMYAIHIELIEELLERVARSWVVR